MVVLGRNGKDRRMGKKANAQREAEQTQMGAGMRAGAGMAMIADLLGCFSCDESGGRPTPPKRAGA